MEFTRADPGGEEEEEEFLDQYSREYLEQFVALVVDDQRREEDVGERAGHGIARGGRDKRSADAFFEWMISPVGLEKFYGQIWEKRPLLIKRPSNRSYFEGWLGKADIAELLSSGKLNYGTDVDITKYTDGVRSTLNEEGVVDSESAWRQFNQSGCSIRLLHPQRWSDPLWLLLSTLERHWSSIAGCNVYLTPSASQGFAPHFDDIDAFILQVEGSKRWRCYRPMTSDGILPRLSSPDFSEDDIGDSILDVVIHPGDLLYMPRGTIHQAEALEGDYSLHLTISAGQRNTWADFLLFSLPHAVELAAEEHVELRQSLPQDMIHIMGVVNAESEPSAPGNGGDEGNKARKAKRDETFLQPLKACLEKVFTSGPWDGAVDQLAAKFLAARLPPYKETGADEVEPKVKRKKGANLESGLSSSGKQTKKKLTLKSRVRVPIFGSCRLVVEGEHAVVYHMMQNSRNEHNVGEIGIKGEGTDEDVDDEDAGVGEGAVGGAKDDDVLVSTDGGSVERGRLEFPLEYAEALETLVLSHECPVKISDLGIEHPSEAIAIVGELLGVGVLELVT